MHFQRTAPKKTLRSIFRRGRLDRPNPLRKVGPKGPRTAHPKLWPKPHYYHHHQQPQQHQHPTKSFRATASVCLHDAKNVGTLFELADTECTTDVLRPTTESSTCNTIVQNSPNQPTDTRNHEQPCSVDLCLMLALFPSGLLLRAGGGAQPKSARVRGGGVQGQ